MVTIPIGMLAWVHLNTILNEGSRPGEPALPIKKHRVIASRNRRNRGQTTINFMGDYLIVVCPLLFGLFVGGAQENALR